MRIEFNPIPVPHRELFLRISAMGLSRRRIPCPYLEWVEQVQPPRQIPRGQLIQAADEIAVNIVRMVLILGEGTVCVDFADADLPELLREDLEVIDQPVAPAAVSRARLRSFWWAANEYRPAKLIKGHFVVSRWQETVWLKGRYIHDSLFRQYYAILAMLDLYVKSSLCWKVEAGPDREDGIHSTARTRCRFGAR